MTEDGDRTLDLADLADFAAAVSRLRKSGSNIGPTFEGFTTANGLYCARCGGVRRRRIRRLFWSADVRNGDFMSFRGSTETPALFSLMCVQCHADAVAVVYMGPSGPELAILESTSGGVATPNTPPGVAYYLDQAHRAEGRAANSAATAMYRSATEMLLFQQGYENGMLNAKIDALLGDGDPPVWRDRIDPDYLRVLRDLGNAAIHPNDGDIVRQAVLDRKLLLEVRVVFQELLDVIYEEPAQRAARKALLESAAEEFRP